MTRISRYLPIVRATHDDDGKVIEVEIDWADSMPAVEQDFDEDIASFLSKFFDEWLQQQPQSTEPGHWKWEVS